MKVLNLARIAGGEGLHHVAVTRLEKKEETIEHTHEDFCEFALALSGKGIHRCNGTESAMRRGDLVFVERKDVHYYIDAGDGMVEWVNFAIPQAWWLEFAHVSGIEGSWKERGERMVSLTESRCRELEADMTRLLESSERGPTVARTALVARLVDLFLRVDVSARRKQPPAWLEKIRREMRDPELMSQPIGYWQKRSGRSKEHFARTCQSCLGMPPTTLLNRARLDWIKARLLKREDKVAALAFDSGFQNLGYFYRVFRRIHGCSPDEWRRRYERDAAVPR